MAAAAAASGQNAAHGVLDGDGAGGFSNPPDRFVFKADWSGEEGKGKGRGWGAQGHQIHTPRAKGAGKGGKNNVDALARHRNAPGWALWEQFQMFVAAGATKGGGWDAKGVSPGKASTKAGQGKGRTNQEQLGKRGPDAKPWK